MRPIYKFHDLVPSPALLEPPNVVHKGNLEKMFILRQKVEEPSDPLNKSLSHGGRSPDGEGSKGYDLKYGKKKWGPLLEPV